MCPHERSVAGAACPDVIVDAANALLCALPGVKFRVVVLLAEADHRLVTGWTGAGSLAPKGDDGWRPEPSDGHGGAHARSCERENEDEDEDVAVEVRRLGHVEGLATEEGVHRRRRRRLRCARPLGACNGGWLDRNHGARKAEDLGGRSFGTVDDAAFNVASLERGHEVFGDDRAAGGDAGVIVDTIAEYELDLVVIDGDHEDRAVVFRRTAKTPGVVDLGCEAPRIVTIERLHDQHADLCAVALGHEPTVERGQLLLRRRRKDTDLIQRRCAQGSRGD